MMKVLLVGCFLLALPTNIGLRTRSEFTVIPELNTALSCQLGRNIRVFAGYNVLLQ